jgi:hypothetical protein
MPDYLLARFPPRAAPDEPRCIRLDDYCSEADIRALAGRLVQLGLTLSEVHESTKRSHEAGDREAVQKGVAFALAAICRALEPVTGAEVLWPVERAIGMLDAAHANKSYWLGLSSSDELSVRQDCPERWSVLAMAAAALQYFGQPPKQGAVAEAIAGALGAGGLWVKRDKKGLKWHEPDARYVIDCRNKLLSPKRGRRPPKHAVPEFNRCLEILRRGGLSTDDSYFKDLLKALETRSRRLAPTQVIAMTRGT